MSILLQKRVDNSLSLVIDGDLQFDSRDERIYHEAFVLPALALLKARLAESAAGGQKSGGLRVLICGGGDGLCAREVLKESLVESVSLVDYDARVIKLAREELCELNDNSLADPRLDVQVMDAFDFVAYARADGIKFDLIVCDFTVPRNLAGAKLLGVEWFSDISALLSASGIACINGVSPCLYSDAYWSIYNSLRTSGLVPLPFRVPLPSFNEAGYGPDWGFFMASKKSFSRAELSADLQFVGENHQLKTVEQWRKLHLFPSSMAGRRAFSKPTAANSDLLITYLSNPQGEGALIGGGALRVSDCDFDFLALNCNGPDPSPLPDPDLGDRVLPEQLSEHLGAVFAAGSVAGAGLSREQRLEEIVAGMGEYLPTLDPGHSRSMVEQFLDDPLRFVRAIDLSDLVERLLQRASELPKLFVDELIALKAKLVDFVCDRDNLLSLGSKALAVISLVVILGNLVFVDNAYGKGGHGYSYGHVSDSPGSLSRPGHSRFDGEFAPAEYATGPGFRPGNYGYGRSVDETGFVFPARRYRYYGYNYNRHYYYGHRTPHSQPPKEIYASYRLTPEADVLPDGTVVINLTDDTFLQLGATCNTLVDAWTGVPICDLARDPAQTFRVCKEVERQTAGMLQSVGGKSSWIKWMDWLDFVPWYADDQAELKNLLEMETRLESARKSLGVAPPVVPALLPPPVVGAIEVFASVWIMPDGKSLIVQRPEGMAYYDEKNWYSDFARTKVISEEYPKDLGRAVLSFYRKELRESDEIVKRLNKEKVDAETDYSGLMRDLSEYKACYRDTSGYELVDYGTTQIRLDDAVSRTQKDLDLTQQRIKLITDQITRLPKELATARIFVQKFGPLYDKTDKKAGAGSSASTNTSTNTSTSTSTNTNSPAVAPEVKP